MDWTPVSLLCSFKCLLVSPRAERSSKPARLLFDVARMRNSHDTFLHASSIHEAVPFVAPRRFLSTCLGGIRRSKSSEPEHRLCWQGSARPETRTSASTQYAH